MQNQQNTPTNNYADDEIDLFELWNSLWEQKILILAITALFTVGGVLFALSKTPVYKANTSLLPPLPQDVQAINHNIKGLSYNPSQAYERLQTNLRSVSVRRDFFSQYNLISHFELDEDASPQRVFEKQFHEKLNLNVPSGRGADSRFVSVSFEFSDKDLSAVWLNKFVEYSMQATIDELVSEVRFEVARQIKLLEDEIESKRELAAVRREDRVVELMEALQIAKAMGIESAMIEQAANQLNMEFMRGVRSIQAEIEVLNTRKSDDPFILDMRNLQENIAYLKGINLDPNLLKVARIDQLAETPISPIKPNKKLIVAVALVLGGMLGVFVALIRSAIRKRREQNAAAV